MNQRVRNVGLAGLAFLTVAVLALHIVWPQPGQEEDYWPWPLGLMAFPVAAAFILVKRPGNGVGRALGVVAVASLFIFAGWLYVGTYPDSPLSVWADQVSTVATLLQFGGMIGLLFVFPTGRPLNRFFRVALIVFAWTILAASVLWFLSPGPLALTGAPNPAGILPGWMRPLVDEGGLWDMAFIVFAVLGIASLVVRWRGAYSVERAQLRWFLGAAVVSGIALTLSDTDELFAGPAFVEIGAGLLLAAALFWSLPAAIVIAVTRYRLYEIDRLFSRTVSYALVVGLLALVYAAIAVGLPRLLPQGLDSSWAVAAATLVAAGLFHPVRRRVQRLVDRRFNRVRYDAKRQMDRLAGRLRTELNLREINAEMLDVVTTTMQPATASVWIRGIENEFGAGGSRNDAGTVHR